MLFGKKTSPVNLDWGISVDMHNHLLPSIDDGAQDMNQSQQLIAALQLLGFTDLVPTPHIASGLYVNDHATIETAFHGIHTYLSENTNIKLDLPNDPQATPVPLAPLLKGFAAEYMIDDYFEKLMEQRLICYPNTTLKNYVLIEFSYLGLPFGWHETIFALRKQGYQPILAHPERYTYLKPDVLLDKLASTGLLFQLNLLSLGGYYGKEIKANARFFLQEGLYSFAGTDVHHINHITTLQRMKLDHSIAELLQNTHFTNELLLAPL